MYAALSQLCPDFVYTAENKPRGKMIVLEQGREVDANFLVSGLFDYYLKSGDGIVFVGIENHYAHYLTVSRKMGYSIEPAIKDGTLTYIDLFSQTIDWCEEELPFTEETTPLWVQAPRQLITLTLKEGQSQSFVEKLTETITAELAKKKGTPCIVIDNLSLLIELIDNHSLSYKFLRSLQNLAGDGNVSIFALINPAIHEDASREVVRILERSADIKLSALPNPSGFSKDVQGQLVLSLLDGLIYREARLKFKLSESKAEVFSYLSEKMI